MELHPTLPVAEKIHAQSHLFNQLPVPECHCYSILLVIYIFQECRHYTLDLNQMGLFPDITMDDKEDSVKLIFD